MGEWNSTRIITVHRIQSREGDRPNAANGMGVPQAVIIDMNGAGFKDTNDYNHMT